YLYRVYGFNGPEYDANNAGYYIDLNGTSNVYAFYRTYGFNGPEYDGNNAGYYVDPNGTSQFAYLYRTYGFNGPEYDVNNSGYYVDPDGVSVLSNVQTLGYMYMPYLGRYDGGWYLCWSNYFYYGGTCAASDARLKTNVEPLTGVLEKLDRVRGVSFEWKEGARKNDKGRKIGVIAQEMEKVYPELVTTNSDGYKAFLYENFTAVLLEGLKELKGLFDGDHGELMKLRAANDKLEASVESLKAEIKALKEKQH
ncbi:MAG: tail fiber domain-containing protein, partial [Proteobacteria bacterium]|nr:tail fiber domain-containing protein [Pseudomonadota bacterium]